MSKTTLTNTVPITVIAVVGNDQDKDSKEITFVESFGFNLSWSMYATFDGEVSPEELSVKQNIAYQKIMHLCNNYINNSLWYDKNDINVIDAHFSSSQNVLMITPANNVMYLTNCLFAKFNSICDEQIIVNKIDLQEIATGVTYTVEEDTGLMPEVLPTQEEFMGPLSVYDKPWWERSDVSTYDNVALDEEEKERIQEKLHESKELLEEDFKQIEKDVQTYMSTSPEEVAEVIDLESRKPKSKKWTPKIVK